MIKIFVDSSFFVASVKEADENHLKAKNLIEKIRTNDYLLYTSFYTIDESATVLSQRISKQVAIEFLDKFKNKDYMAILELDHISREKSYSLFKQIRSKNISMVDCHSIILMKENGITDCLSFDQHFSQFSLKLLS